MIRFKYLKHLLWVAPLSFLVLLVAVLGINFLGHNVHAVIPGAVYRSAQLDATTLAAVVKRYHIRAIINLRGPHPAYAWYQAEVRLSAQKQLMHYDITLPAHGLPSLQSLQMLVIVLQHSPRPLLVHCRQGADRTGLASAVSLILAGQRQVAAIKKQMSLYYNVMSPSSVGYEVMSNYFAWLDQHHLQHTRRNFLRWVFVWHAPMKSMLGWFFP